MESWQVALVCFAICIGVLLLIGSIKLIAKKNAEKKGKTIDTKKLEYPLSLAALLLSYGCLILFLYFGVDFEIKSALKYAAPYALSEQAFYVFIVQLARKGISGLLSGIISFINKLKDSKKPIEELPEIVGEIIEETAQDEGSSEDLAEQKGNEIYNDIFLSDK